MRLVAGFNPDQGWAICAQLSRGVTREKVISNVSWVWGGMDAQLARADVAIAVQDLCPDYVQRA